MTLSEFATKILEYYPQFARQYSPMKVIRVCVVIVTTNTTISFWSRVDYTGSVDIVGNSTGPGLTWMTAFRFA